MKRTAMAYTDHFEAVMRVMTGSGLLLAAYDPKGRPNAMAIGWGMLGSAWGIPQWIVLVRPSRYTYDCIEASRAFSVCVPGADLDEACAICGSKSGRHGDKLAEAGLKVEKGKFGSPLLPQCPILYECTVIHHNDVLPDRLASEVRRACYGGGDYHRLYYGKIEAVTASVDVHKLPRG